MECGRVYTLQSRGDQGHVEEGLRTERRRFVHSVMYPFSHGINEELSKSENQGLGSVISTACIDPLW